jgi:hypothetical protein
VGITKNEVKDRSKTWSIQNYKQKLKKPAIVNCLNSKKNTQKEISENKTTPQTQHTYQ